MGSLHISDTPTNPDHQRSSFDLHQSLHHASSNHPLNKVTRSPRRDSSPLCSLSNTTDYNEDRGRTSSTPVLSHSYQDSGRSSSSSKRPQSSRCTSLPTQETRLHVQQHQQHCCRSLQHTSQRSQSQQQIETSHSVLQSQYSVPAMLYGVPPNSLPQSLPSRSVYPPYNFTNDINYHHRPGMSLPQPLMYQYWSYPYVGQGGVANSPHSLPPPPPSSSMSQHSYKQQQRYRQSGEGRSKNERTKQSTHRSTNHSTSSGVFISPADKRYNIYKNLCGLFPRDVVESVMASHPEITETKKLVKLCLGES